MRVVHVVTSIAVQAGGLPLAVFEIAAGASDHGIDSTILSTTAMSGSPKDPSGVVMATRSGGLDVRIGRIVVSERVAFSPELLSQFRSMAPPNVIHIHGLFQYPQYAAVKFARREGIPWIVSPHGALDPHLRQRGRLRKALVGRWWQDAMLNDAAAIVYSSDGERMLVEDLGYEATSVVIPNPFDFQAWTLPPSSKEVDRLRLELGLGEGPVIGNHGRLTAKKGLPFLVDAISILRKKYPSIRLLLVGPNSMGTEAQLKEMAHRLDVDRHIIFAGTQSGLKLQQYLGLMDVWALPSYSENFGYALVEALAAAIPVVTTEYVNIAKDGQSEGALEIAQQSGEAFARVIDELLSDEQRRDKLRSSGLGFIQRYDPFLVGQRYAESYREFANRKGVGLDDG